MFEYLNFHTAAACGAALLVGGMSFFSFAVTPIAFRSLSRDNASAFLRAAFPVYYRAMAVCSFAAAFFVFYRVEAVWFAIIGICFVALDLLLRPKLEALRGARQAGDEVARRAFGRLHAISVIVNLGQWAGAIVLFFRLAA